MCTPTHTYRYIYIYIFLRGLIPGGAWGCQVPQLITAWSCSLCLPLIRRIAAHLFLGGFQTFWRICGAFILTWTQWEVYRLLHWLPRDLNSTDYRLLVYLVSNVDVSKSILDDFLFLTAIFLSRCLSKLTFRSINFCALSLTKVKLFSSSMMLFCTSAMFDNGAWKCKHDTF